MSIHLPTSASRLKAVREALRYTQKEFGELLGISGSTADMERGKTKLSGLVVMQLFDRFKINPLWLYGKSDRKYLETTLPNCAPKVLVTNQDGEETIALVPQKAAAGYPENIHEPQWFEDLPRFRMPLPEFRNATYRGFQVEGDSMLPNIRPNDWVLGKAVASFKEVSFNKIHIVVLLDSVLVKQLERIPQKPEWVRLVSINTTYPPIEVPISSIQELWQVNSTLSFGVEAPRESKLLEELKHSMESLKQQVTHLTKVSHAHSGPLSSS